MEQIFDDDKIIYRCKKCKKKTLHKLKGFKYYNRRYECLECGYEVWE